MRIIAAAETAGPAALGTVLGLVLFLLLKVLVQRHYDGTAAPTGLPRFQRLPTDVGVPVVRSLLVVLLVPALAAASALASLRRVEVSPFGVTRRVRPSPRGWAVLPLVSGLLLLVAGTLLGEVSLLLVAIGVAAVVLSLASCGSWLAARTGAVVAGQAGRPALVLAARRLQDDPRAQGRELFGVVLAVLTGCAVAVTRSSLLRMADRADSFYRTSDALVGLAVAVALAVATAALAVATVEAVLDRRRSTVSLWAVGVPLATVRRAVVLQTLLPAVPASIVAAATGTAAGGLYARASGSVSVPWLQLAGVVGLGLAVTVAATGVSLPLLPEGDRCSACGRRDVAPFAHVRGSGLPWSSTTMRLPSGAASTAAAVR